MTITRPNAIAPGQVRVADAERALRRITSFLAAHPADERDLVPIGPEIGQDDKLMIPRPILDMLVGIFEAVAAGRGVQIMPYNLELTTQQAADVLNVSRPYLIKLLEGGEIAYRRVGRHRRIRLDSLLVYKAADDAHRRSVADELSGLGQEFGGD
jgi:excisionase family DNA binding protein